MTSTGRIASQRAEARVAAILPELVETRREIARLQAVEASLLAHAGSIAADWAAESDPRGTSGSEFPYRSVAAEIAAAWRVSDRTVQRQIGDAAELVEEFPETHAALAAGEISAVHARIIVSTGAVIERPELKAEFERSVLDYAKAESASRLGPIAKRRAEWFTESSCDDRHRRGRESRRTWLEDLDDGMSILHLLGPTVLVHAAHQRATDYAHAVRNHASDAAPDDSAALDDSGADDGPETSGEIIETADEAGTADDTGTAGATETASDTATESPAVAKDTRTIDQLRCDILFDLILAGVTAAHDTGLAAIRPIVTVTVLVLALIDDGIRDPFDAAELDGHGPIDTDSARMLAGAASGWERVLTHPITGAVLGVDRYTPSEQLRRHLRVRDQHCRFPGCRMPTRRCDIDH